MPCEYYDRHPKAQVRGLEQVLSSPPSEGIDLDIRFLLTVTSSTVRKQISVAKSPSCGTMLQQPWQTCLGFPNRSLIFFSQGKELSLRGRTLEFFIF